MNSHPLKILQFICSTGFYGAEGWVLALANNSDPQEAEHHLAVTRECGTDELELTRRYRQLALPVHELIMSGRFDLRVVRSLIQLIKRHNIDVLHTHGYKSDLLGLIAARIAGISCVSTPHGFENSQDWKLRSYIWLGCRAFRYFDKVVPLSSELLDDIRRLSVPEQRIDYIANGVDLKPLEPYQLSRAQQVNALQQRAPVIGYIGQLIERKNVNDILSAYAVLQEAIPELRLVIVGDGESREALERQVSEMECRQQVEFTGFVSDPLAHLQGFDLFVMTSTLEGIPRCLMESMAMGVPVVAYDIPGVDQLVRNASTGLLAPFGDVESLTLACKKVLNDSALAQTLSEAGRRHVADGFSARRMADEYLGLYQQLLGESVQPLSGGSGL